MSLIRMSDLPSFERVREAGGRVAEQPSGPGTHCLRVGLVNLMPDAALTATERQFLMLLDAYADDADICVHIATLGAEARGDAAKAHIAKYYDDLHALTARSLDALIITGANPEHELLPDESFWPELTQLLDWAQTGVRSVLCSCLATHAVVEHFFGSRRERLPAKQWGIYGHRIAAPGHPLLAGLEEPVHAPHSHNFSMSADTMRSLGLIVLVESDEAGVHMAALDGSPDYVFFQGHPEYDAISLMKEYKREVTRYFTGDRGDYPPFPDHYFPQEAHDVLTRYRHVVEAAKSRGDAMPAFPEPEISDGVVDTWGVAGRQVYRNWLKGLARS